MDVSAQRGQVWWLAESRTRGAPSCRVGWLSQAGEGLSTPHQNSGRQFTRWGRCQVCRAGPWEKSKVARFTGVTCSHVLPRDLGFRHSQTHRLLMGAPRRGLPYPSCVSHVPRLSARPPPGPPIFCVSRPAILICNHILVNPPPGQLESLLPFGCFVAVAQLEEQIKC